MKTRKLFAMALALVMALSLAVPAFAEDKTTEITATYKDIELDVTVTSSVTAQINPYGLPVTLNADEGIQITGQQITCSPATIENRSSVDLKASAKIAATIPNGSGVTFVASAPSDITTETSKGIYVQLQVAGTDLVQDYESATLQAKFATETNWASATSSSALTSSTDADNNTTISATGSNLVTLTKGSEGAAVSGGIAMFRLKGTLAQNPNTAWATTDGFTATVTWTFVPVAS